MWIVRLALRRPYTVLTMCLLVVLFGAIAVGRMQRDILPTIDIPVVIVIWSYPGLTAEEVERRIVYITERALSTTVGGISHVESQSLSGIGLVKAYFEEGTDIGSAVAQITSVCNTILRILPPGIQPPSILQYNVSNVQVAQLTVSGDVPEQELFDYGLNFLRVRLFTIPGLSTPAPYGGRSRQVMVDVDLRRAAAKGLSAQDVANALLQQNVIIPAGVARIGSVEYDVSLNASPERIPEFNQLPIKVVEGAIVRLGDVAFVHDGFAVQQNIVRVDGRRATYLALLRKSGASTLAVVDSVRDLLPTLRAAAPQGVELRIDFDQSMFVRAAIRSVLREGAIAAVLVSLMIFFFLGSWRSMVIVCISIPIAIVAGVVGLYLTGHTLNLMTLGGLALAVGMLVDDATVEVENIHRNRLAEPRLLVAILHGAKQVAVPALAATLTICIVFFPVVLLQGPARFLFTPLALSVVFSMLASYLLSRTLVPSLAHKLMPKERLHGGRFDQFRDRQMERLVRAYERALRACLHHRALVLALAGVGALVSLTLVGVVGLDFFPRVDTGQLRLHVRGPTGLRLEETEALVERVEQTIRRVIPPGELATLNDNIGIPTFYNLAFIPSDNVGSQDGEILIALAPGHRPSEGYEARLRRELEERFPEARFYFMPADLVTQVLNFGVPSALDVQVVSQDPRAALAVAQRLTDRVRQIPGANDVRIAQVIDHPAFRLDVDRARASLIGVSQRDVASTMLTALSSSALVSPSYWINPDNGVNYLVAVQAPTAQVASIDDLLTAPVASVAGATTAPYVGGLAALRRIVDRSSISHYAVQPVIDVQGSVRGRDLGAVSRDVHRAMRAVDKPKNVTLALRGQSEVMNAAFTSFGLGLVVAIALVYLLMMVLFQSALDPFIIMVAVPGAFVGILWMLALTGTTLNVESFMGAIMAVGIAVSNSILLVSFANDMRAAEALSPDEAVVRAGTTRLRPVLMTALAMILGMLPMALALGEGGEQNAPLGRAVIGGLLVATFVTLFVVPLVYAITRKAPPTKQALDQRFEAELAESQ
jgi:multidrug efflux pump subunit AcrB